MQSPLLQKLIKDNQLLAFTDGILIKVKTKLEAELTIDALKSLKEFDLVTNKLKS